MNVKNYSNYISIQKIKKKIKKKMYNKYNIIVLYKNDLYIKILNTWKRWKYKKKKFFCYYLLLI